MKGMYKLPYIYSFYRELHIVKHIFISKIQKMDSHGSVPKMDRHIFLSPLSPDWPWGPSNLAFNGTGDLRGLQLGAVHSPASSAII
jgi:hypothetical protein